jgi:hypothetical protein
MKSFFQIQLGCLIAGILLPLNYARAQSAAGGVTIDIASPTNGSVFPAPTNIDLIAGVTDTNGPIAYVEFLDSVAPYVIGIVSNGVVVDPPGSPGLTPGSRAYLYNWTNQSYGNHALRAAAVDTNGNYVLSAPVQIIIGSNLPPVVRITSPPNHTLFHAPVDIEIIAYANDPDGYVSTVEFFAGTNSLGFAQPLPVAIPLIVTRGLPPFPPPRTNIFVLTWSNAPVGDFALTAVATDNDGASTTSAPVNVAIVRILPPPITLPPIVDIVATDPIAIAGTNCWTWRGLADDSPLTPATWTTWISPIALWRWYTNCGPTDGTFTLHRFGRTNDDLQVNYAIGGTASNGVDYVTLPGSFTIPAGHSDAMIDVIPIEADDTNADPVAADAIKTVVLALKPSTNTPLSYIPGFPRDAEVLIIEGNAPPVMPLASVLTDGSFSFHLTGPDGAWFHVDYSTNGLSWTTICTNQVIDGSIYFVDPDATDSAARLYRAIPLATALTY